MSVSILDELENQLTTKQNTLDALRQIERDAECLDFDENRQQQLRLKQEIDALEERYITLMKQNKETTA